VAFSKTYAGDGTCQPTQKRNAIRGAADRASEPVMMDILMVALAFAFFAAAIGYTYACERL
jgi:hypothetical protein